MKSPVPLKAPGLVKGCDKEKTTGSLLGPVCTLAHKKKSEARSGERAGLFCECRREADSRMRYLKGDSVTSWATEEAFSLLT